MVPLQPLVMTFKSCRLFDPIEVDEMQPDAAAVNTLRCVSFSYTDNAIQPIQHELAAYQALTDDILGTDKCACWHGRVSIATKYRVGQVYLRRSL